MTQHRNGHLSAEDLLVWRGDRCLFRDLSLDLLPGQLLHVTGRNGSGKTTLLRVLCGLSEPEHGQITWDGRSIRQDAGDYHDNLAYLGHRDGLKGDLTAIENLKFHFALRSYVNIGRIEEALRGMGLERALSLPTRFLSAGQRRRVALTRVILSRVPLWILDEPYANLDAQGQALITHRVTDHLERGGLAVMAVHQALTFNIRRIVALELG